jgi:hypothetical protein
MMGGAMNRTMTNVGAAALALVQVIAVSVQAAEPARYDREADKHSFTVFMPHGGWCWYQDPRAIAHAGKLFIGSVRGNGDGEALVGVYDLAAGKAMGSVVVHPKFDRDDHNSPVFWVRPDGKVLTVYARHHRDDVHRSRVCDPAKPLEWSEEVPHVRQSGNARDRVTYMNLYYLADEKKLYNFFRFIDFNPTFVTSTDGGETWSEPAHFFKNEVGGRHRPYPRYASNGRDTVYVSMTDAHPRNYGNSICYFEFRGGRYYRADGTVIKDRATDGPLRPSEAERVYQGSMTKEKPTGFESVPGAAWTSAIAVDGEGRPHIAYSLYLSNDEHRYRLASWDGAKWVDREIAHAGGCLYPRESSYTGLVTMDPVDPTVVFISTDVDPQTGKSTGGKHEIYRAKVGLGDDVTNIEWHAVTRDSKVRNIRPMVVRDGAKRIVLWQRGEFRTFTNYDLDTVGLVEAAVE